MTDRIEELLSDYWNAAYAEGCDGRIHDTDKGDAQKALSGIHAEFEALRKRVNELELELDQNAAALNALGKELAALKQGQGEPVGVVIDNPDDWDCAGCRWKPEAIK